MARKASSNKILEHSFYTLVQHSAFGYNGKPGFERGVESRWVGTHQELRTVRNAGGLLFPNYGAAEDFALNESDDGSLYPRMKGTFSNVEFDGLKIYVPTPQERLMAIEKYGVTDNYDPAVAAL